MKTEKQIKVENYLKEWGKYINLSAVSRECEIPETLLRNWLNGKKYRLDKYVDSLHKLFTEMKII